MVELILRIINAVYPERLELLLEKIRLPLRKRHPCKHFQIILIGSLGAVVIWEKMCKRATSSYTNSNEKIPARGEAAEQTRVSRYSTE
jgi:hypothetical protein